MIEYAPPPSLQANGPVISTLSPEVVGGSLQFIGTTAPASGAYPLANVALYFPLVIAQPVTVKGVFWYNGTVTGGNCDVGVYSESGTRLFSVGSTGRGSASAVVRTSLGTAYTLARGRYYLAFAHDGTNNFFRLASSAPLCQMFGIMEQTSAFALPATATFASTTRAFIPLVGLTLGTAAPTP